MDCDEQLAGPDMVIDPYDQPTQQDGSAHDVHLTDADNQETPLRADDCRQS